MQKSAISRRRRNERGCGFQRPCGEYFTVLERADLSGVFGRQDIEKSVIGQKIRSAGRLLDLPFPVILGLDPRIGGSTRREETSGAASALRRILGSSPEMRGIDRDRQSRSLAQNANIPKVGLGWEADPGYAL